MTDEEREPNYDNTFAFLEILIILSDSKKYQKWLSEFHNIEQHQEFLEGYKYIQTVSYMYLINNLISFDPFNLKDDEIITRAEFMGKNINDIPNSCEKTTVLKNIWKQSKRIRQAKSFEEIQNAETPKIVKIYESLREKNIVANKQISKEESILAITKFNAYLLLVDTSFGMPRATRWASIFEIEESLTYLETVFNGYRYALEYLWFCLLGPEEFQRSFLRDLHRSDKIHFKDDSKTISIKLGKNVENSTVEEYEEPEEDRIRREEWDRVHGKWRTIDQFFGKMRSEMIHPLERKTGSLGGFDKGFVRLENFSKDQFEELITEEPEDAPYMIKDDEESLKERIKSDFLWYPISVLNSAKTFTFNGSFSFVAMLRGLVSILREQDNAAKVTVHVIKHPAYKVENGHDYSFGIRVGVGGFFSDSSGWLIFHDCATDYSGSGGQYLKMCMDEIEKHKQQDAVEIKEQIINSQLFEKFLADEGISMDYEKSRKVFEKMNESYSKIKGKLLEYLVYKWINSKEQFEIVYCDYIVKEEQIDCFCKSGNQIEHFECKMQVHKIQETIDQIKRKHLKIKEENRKEKINANLVLYATITNDVKRQFEKEGIIVYQDFKSTIENDRVFDGTRRELKSYLDSDSNYYDFI